MRARHQELLETRPHVSVGILTADLLSLGAELRLLTEAGVRLVHVDVMDGCFCPLLTVGPAFLKSIQGTFLKDVHLMIDEPVDKVHGYVDAGADVLTFHVEATRHHHRVLQSLAGSEVVRGVALNPGTPLTTLEPLLNEVELVLLLAVNPGWSGQSFIPATEQRVAAARDLIDGRDILLGVDGGITKENVRRVAALGVDLIVTGSAVFDGGDALANARFMLEEANSAGVARGR